MNAVLHVLMFLFLLVPSIVATLKGFPRANKNDIFLVFFLLCLLLFAGWRMWIAVSQVWVRKPLLLLNNVGIFVYEFPKIDVFDRGADLTPLKKRRTERPYASLLWQDIETITTTRYLVILPRNVPPPGRRYSKRKIFTVKTGEPIFIPQRYLDCPFEEVLQQMRTTFSKELEHYQIEM